MKEVDVSTIRLNGTVEIIPPAKIADGVLMVRFDRSAALQSLGTAVHGTVYPRVQGKFRVGDDVFSGQGRVELKGNDCAGG